MANALQKKIETEEKTFAGEMKEYTQTPEGEKEHLHNPLHLFCRYVEKGRPIKVALKISLVYEKNFYIPYIMSRRALPR